ncbi:N-acetylmuramoyl-L-alanine amidase family protein [Lysinibacillus fusiformis]|uniref:N-acetylmuramoyl-L-alanine amidase family protein n=1 Tax=Lysinibacillus fusiformis TaxID=28031 RepID=UPI0020BE8561|nr:N-acetylmuramoyl-L-alanine amidase [Lysinibacillus fusiformis]
MKKIVVWLVIVLLVMGIGFSVLHLKAKKQPPIQDFHLSDKIIVIDPGHGGGDRGARGEVLGTIEKDLNLKIAHNIKKELEGRTNATVILTREDDNSLLPETNQKEELRARVKVAKDYSADLYICIHHDAFDDTTVRGITTHYGTSKNNDKQLAKMVQKAIFNQNIATRDRGVQESDFHVLRENSAPAILMELGFISNEDDEMLMNSPTFQAKTQQGIVDGIIEYFN